MKSLLTCLLLLASLCPVAAKEHRVASVASPDAKNIVNILYDGQTLHYEVFRNEERILAPSPLTMTVDGRIWGSDARPNEISCGGADRTERFVVARKYPSVRDSYREVSLHYSGYRVEVRAYNDGVAYRFVGTTGREGCVEREGVAYAFDADCPPIPC